MPNKQLSLFEQSREAKPGLSDEDLVVSLAEELLDDADAKPPVDVEMLASMRGISTIEVVDQPFAGMLLPQEGRLVVRVRATDASPRQRFTILHEAGHTFLPGFSQQTQYRCNGETNRVEALSDLFASELLFPRRHFLRDLTMAGEGLDAVETLAAVYDASIEATGLRFVDLGPVDTSMLVFSVTHKPSERGREESCSPKLRLTYAHSKGSWPFMRRAKSVEEDSLFARALEGEFIDEVGELGNLCADDIGQVAISARRYGKDGRVIALVQRNQRRGGHQ